MQNRFPVLKERQSRIVYKGRIVYNGGKGIRMSNGSERPRMKQNRISSVISVAAMILTIISSTSTVVRTAEAEMLYAVGDTVIFVVHISVDGLRSDAITHLGVENLPNFFKMRVLGAFTDNARTDFDYTNTLPNHACQLTGRPVLGVDGHGVSFNEDPGTTFEYVNGHYISGVFDVAHDHGLGTAMYASKPKFDFFDRSWNEENGALDVTGEDNGRDKIDTYINSSDTGALVDSFIAHLDLSPHEYNFIHFVDPDAVGHDSGWGSVAYYNSVMKMDTLLGRIFAAVEGDERFEGRAAILMTADHGGTGTSHYDPTLPENYTVPFYVTAPGAPAGVDLYWLNPVSRLDPGTGRPDYIVTPQPVRNGGVTNLALDLLSLGAIPGSSVNGVQDLDVTLSGGSAALPAVELMSPSDGDVFDAPTTISIKAAASAVAGTVSMVEFFADYAKIGEDTSAPYNLPWTDVLPGEYVITARAVTDLGAASTSSVGISVISTTPAQGDIGLGDIIIYPNPFRRSATIRFSLREQGAVELFVFDVLGRRVGSAVEGSWEAGVHRAVLDASGISPGCYFYHARLGKAIRTGKFMVLR